MVRVYVNGVEVKKEDLEKIEIKSETVKRILADKVSDKKKVG